LKRPDPLWQYTPAVDGWIFEKAFQDSHRSTFGQPGTLVMGTGPWKFDSLDPTSSVELSANAHWWGGEVPIQHVSFKFFGDEQGVALAMRGGEIDLDPFVVGDKAFEATSTDKVVDIPSSGNAFFAMNTKKPPWDDVHVRRAAAYAIDKLGVI